MWLSSARFYTRKAKGDFWNLGGPWPLWPPLNPPMCLGPVWVLSESCLGPAWILSAVYWVVSGSCLGAVWMLSGSCLGLVWGLMRKSTSYWCPS